MRGRGGVLAWAAAIAVAVALAAPASAQVAGSWAYPGGIAVAPDNRHVYVTSHDGTLALARDPATGTLTQVSLHGGAGGPVEVAPDGSSVYAGRMNPSSTRPELIAFARDPAQGTLRRTVPVSGASPNRTIQDIAVSPDGANVYVTETGGELVIFARHASNGSLTRLGAAPPAGGVGELEGLAASPDGRWIYAVGQSSPKGDGSRVVRFERLPGGGLAVAEVRSSGAAVGDTVALSPAGWMYVGAAGLTALRWDSASGAVGEIGQSPAATWGGGTEPGGSGLAVAGDGALFALDLWGRRLVQLRATSDGYEVVRSYRDGEDGISGLGHPRSVAISPDGAHVYVAGGQDSFTTLGTVAVFSRDSSGSLTFTSLFTATPSSGPALAISINDGDKFTHTREVRVRVTGADPVATGVELAHAVRFTGGTLTMIDPQVFPPSTDGSYPWTLRRANAKGLAVVHAREVFDEADRPERPLTVLDLITLDERRPRLVSARATRATTRGRARLRLRARDNRSGVRRVQVTSRRSRPGRRHRFRRTLLLRSLPARSWARVIDGAGNRSAWRRVTFITRRR
jgi:DNA-binding beta-propeller fold protein YncE